MSNAAASLTNRTITQPPLDDLRKSTRNSYTTVPVFMTLGITSFEIYSIKKSYKE